VVNRSPKIVGFSADSYEHFVEMPAPPCSGPHLSGTLLPNLGRKQGTKPVPPGSYRLVADIDPAFLEQILDLTQRQRKPDIHHHRQADHLGRCLEVSEGIPHPRTLRDALSAIKPFYPDTALATLNQLKFPKMTSRSACPIVQRPIDRQLTRLPDSSSKRWTRPRSGAIPTVSPGRRGTRSLTIMTRSTSPILTRTWVSAPVGSTTTT